MPPRLDRLILRLLEKAPDDRPESAAAVRAELDRIAADPEGAEDAEPAAGPRRRLAGGAMVGPRPRAR